MAVDGYVDERLRLTHSSLGVWQADAEYLRQAEAGSRTTGIVDGHNLMRAGELLQQIDDEKRVLRNLADRAEADAAAKIESLLAAVAQVEDEVKAASRALHGLT